METHNKVSEDQQISIEMFYTFSCPNCKILQRMLEEVLPEYGDKFKLKRTLTSGPMGMLRTMKLGIHMSLLFLLVGQLHSGEYRKNRV